MPKSFMQHQREQDDAAEIEARADELQEIARGILSGMKRYEYPDLTEYGMLTDDRMDEFDVMEQVDELCRDEVVLALSLLNSDPLESVRILKEARDKAVDHTLARIDFERVARAEREQQRRVAA